MSDVLILGIDPGKQGGIAWIRGNEYGAVKMPLTRHEVYSHLSEITFQPCQKLVAVVEAVHSMPKQGVASTFKFGKGYGEVLGMLTAIGAQIHEPTPQAWKKEMLAGTDKGKDASIQRAENLFPNINLVAPGCRIPSDGMAEALLLAEYGRRTCI